MHSIARSSRKWNSPRRAGVPASWVLVDSEPGGGPAPNSIGPLKYKSDELGEPGSAKVLHVSVDTLKYWFRLSPASLQSLRPQLQEWKALASLPEAESRYAVPGLPLFASAKGRNGIMPFVLISPDIGEFAVCTRETMLGVHVKLYAQYLARFDDWKDAVAGARSLVLALFGQGSIVAELVGEVHVAVDYTGLVPTFGLLQSKAVVTYADKPELIDYDDEYDVIHSMRFGGSRSPVSIAWYDKPKEIREQSPHKSYLLDMYSLRGWDGSSPVYRFEGRFNREFLHDVGMNTLDDVDLRGLLLYLIGDGCEHGGYFSVREVSTDVNRSRWRISDTWHDLVAGALALLGEGIGVAPVRCSRKVPTVRVLANMITGCASSLAALVGEGDIYSAIEFAVKWNAPKLRDGPMSWDRVLDRKRARYMVLAG